MAQILGGAIGGTILYIFREEIRRLGEILFNQTLDRFFYQIEIDIRTAPKCARAVKTEVERVIRSKYISMDGQEKPFYKVADGQYVLEHEIKTAEGTIKKYIMSTITDKTVHLMVFRKSYKGLTSFENYVSDTVSVVKWLFTENIRPFKLGRDDISSTFLRDYLDNLVKKHCKSEDVLCFMGHREGVWNDATFRRPRKLDKIVCTKDMLKVLEDIDEFIKNERVYESRGEVWRRGYLLEGPEGTGKTTVPEIVSIKYNRMVYNVSLNDSEMDDNVLKSLVNKVPPRSIILFDEVDSYLIDIDSKKSMVTPAGIKRAIDGIERLSSGTILIWTTNSIANLDKKFKEQLLRRGRIDKYFVLKEKLCNTKEE